MANLTLPIRFASRPLSKNRTLGEYDGRMGEVRARLRLRNSADLASASEGKLAEEQIRSWEGDGVVDTGAIMLALPAEAVRQLGLQTTRKMRVRLANETALDLDVAGPVDLVIGQRGMSTEALVLPEGAEPLIGQIVLERLDLLVDPLNETLVIRPGSDPEKPTLKLK